jgi:hypothetical protein
MRSQSRSGILLSVAAAALLTTGGAGAQPSPPLKPPSTAPGQPPPPPPPPAAAAPAAAPPLSESLTGMAKAEYEAGRILYGDKDYANAILKFMKAHELSKDPRLLWNIAVCQKNLRRYSKMLATIHSYQVEAADLLTAEEKAQSVEIVKTVESFVSRMKLTASEEGAEVFVDDEKVGETPLREPVLVDVGTRKIHLVKKGFKDLLVSKEVTGGGELTVDVLLEKEIHRGQLAVNAGANDMLSLDGKVVGKGHWEGSLPSGGHTLKVTADGMVPYQSEVVIQDEKARRVDVTLNPVPRDATKTVLWIVGGAVLAAGASVGGYFLFKPQTTPSIPGSLNTSNSALPLAFSLGGHRR